jgi:LPXTG-site transpeptidase (sortase) family protein
VPKDHRPASPAINRQALVQLYRKALSQGVELKTLDKKIEKLVTRSTVTQDVEAVQDHAKKQKLKRQVPLAIKVGAAFLPVVFISLGLVLVSSALFPIVSYYITTLPSVQAAQLTTPIPHEQVLDVNPVAMAQASTVTVTQPGAEQNRYDEPQIIDTELDFTNLSNWFGEVELPSLESDEVQHEYTVDIPKLEISNAKVVMGGTNLNKSLIQFPGTAAPGQYGAPVIFGHSVLRQFYNPSEKNPRRYNSLFSTIMTLKKGDEIFITHNGTRYKYAVQEKSEVKPTDVYILSQRYDARLLKLVTCTPEGTYLRRGVITAQLIATE